MLIVGAGPTGLALALSLVRAGIVPRIVDARTGVDRESRALDVQARTLELYAQLGVADLLVDRGTRIDHLAVRTAGRVVASVDLTEAGRGLSPYPFILCCPQDEHERLLGAELEKAGVRVEWATTLLTASDHDDRVDVTLDGPEGEFRLEVGYVCGCDGARSTVRQQLGVPFRGDGSEQTYFVADVTATGPTTPHDPRAGGLFTFCLDKSDFVLVVPARRDQTHRVIGRVPTPGKDGASVTFEDVRPMVERAAATRVDALGWFSTYRVSHRVADQLRRGRVFLLGDAGHVHSPLGGQGMNTGIADAVNLAWKLSAVLQGRADPRLLDTYETERIAFARSLVATTDRLFRTIDGSRRRHRLARTVLFRLLLPTLLGLRATRGRLVGTVSQVRVRYRTSPLSVGRAGLVRGGDRLPWVQAADGTDNYRPEAVPDWRLQVYGSVSPGLRATAVRRGLELQEFAWTDAARSAGLRRHAMYLVRPDGYLALVSRRQDSHRLGDFLDTFALTARA